MTNPNYTAALMSVGVPENLATQVAAIISRDDSTKPDLGRTPEEQAIVTQAWKVTQK